MTDLDKWLDQVESPEPSDMLKARILREAKAQRSIKTIQKPANDNHFKRWAGLVAVALILGVVGVSTLNPVQTSDDEVWLQAAENMGYEDLYAWVEGDAAEGESLNAPAPDTY